jgi:isochorismate synthase
MISPARAVAEALAALDASRTALAVATIPAPPVPLSAARLPAELGAILRWEDPAPDRDGHAWSFLAAGEIAVVEGSAGARLDEVRARADALFASLSSWVHADAAFAPPPRLHGGIAFRPEPRRGGPWSAFRDASFTLPRWLYGTSGDRAFLRIARRAGEPLDEATIASVLDALTAGARESAPPRSGAELTRTSVEAWTTMIEDALGRIRAGEMEKVVATTLSKVTTAGGLCPRYAVDRLGELYPECVRFAFQRGDGVFLGASPERLLTKVGLAVTSDALAGTAPRRVEGDARAASALLESDKDRREHRVVVDAVRAALAPHAARVVVPEAPVLRSLRNVHHLWTPITATLARPTHVLDLVRSLHPTPAVCGTPRDAAIAWIASHEPETRGWYAGAVGWFDAEGDGAFSVAIRSGVLGPREAWLYAGAGIVEGSDPALEYAETRAKQAPMLAALGITP